MSNTEKKRRSGCFWFFIVLLLMALGVSVLMNVGLLAESSLTTERFGASANQPIDQVPDFNARWSYGYGDIVVARIPLSGIITRQLDGSWLVPGVDRVQLLINRIRAATLDPTVRAIILEVDSPGGAVTPSDEILHALDQFRAVDEDRVIVVFATDIIASGAYYAAMAADWIITEPTSLVGSIGVLIQTLNLHELSRRIGIQDTTIKSGASKDILNPFREPTEQDIGILQNVVDSMYHRFARRVQDVRGIDPDRMPLVADGRIFPADDALAEGLIDEIGYWDDAVARVARLLEVSEVRVIRYDRRTDWTEWLLQSRARPDWTQVLADWERPRILYLWRP